MRWHVEYGERRGERLPFRMRGRGELEFAGGGRVLPQRGEEGGGRRRNMMT